MLQWYPHSDLYKTHLIDLTKFTCLKGTCYDNFLHHICIFIIYYWTSCAWFTVQITLIYLILVQAHSLTTLCNKAFFECLKATLTFFWLTTPHKQKAWIAGGPQHAMTMVNTDSHQTSVEMMWITAKTLLKCKHLLIQMHLIFLTIYISTWGGENCNFSTKTNTYLTDSFCFYRLQCTYI